VAVSDADPARAASAAQGRAVQVHADPHDLIRDPEVHAALVASPDETHEELVLACLRAGKPVLCEKPLAATADASLRVIAAEVALGRRLVQVGFMRSYDPGYVDVKKTLDEGRVGDPLLLHCVHRNPTLPAPYFTSEMLISNAAVHDIDAARWLLGQEFVNATVYTPRPTDRVSDSLRDPQLVVLETEGGVVVDVEIFVSAQYGYDIRCELVCESGTLALALPATVQIRRDGHDSSPVAEDFRARFAPAYRHELQAWVDALGDEQPSGPSAWDSYVATAVADACLESLASGQRADVRLEPRPDLYA
jgi:myo-inositol 2-dehydrogenase / D-chiro-inositol 1-dehydrogenase